MWRSSNDGPVRGLRRSPASLRRLDSVTRGRRRGGRSPLSSGPERFTRADRAFPVGEGPGPLLSRVASPGRFVSLRDSGEVAPSASPWWGLSRSGSTACQDREATPARRRRSRPGRGSRSVHGPPDERGSDRDRAREAVHRWRVGGSATSAVIEVISPHTEEVVATVPEASTADVDRAVDVAREGLRRRRVAADLARGPHRRRPALQRRVRRPPRGHGLGHHRGDGVTDHVLDISGQAPPPWMMLNSFIEHRARPSHGRRRATVCSAPT